MSARDCPFPARLASCALPFLLSQLGCSPQYELLRTLDAGGAGGTFASAGSSSGNPTLGGTASVGATDPGGSSAVGGTDSGVGQLGGYTSGGTGYAGSGGEFGGSGGGEYGGNASGGGGNAVGQACTMHGQCAFGAVCGDYRCQACPATPIVCPGPCEHGFQPLRLARNGCEVCECVPPSECTSDAGCQSNETCYAGAHCEDGCSEPSCCYGNRCSRAGCAGERPPLCLAFGCSEGESCLAACDATSCECDGADWTCESTTGGAPVASCPQACAPP